jgi:urease subunit alpha
MYSSDSQAMGRVGECYLRLFQTAHKMKEARGLLPEEQAGDDNQRILRYLAKLTINPAVAHGVDHLVGSLEAGKLADIVLWPVGFFAAKPALVIKGGAIAWAVMGGANASVPTVEPLLCRPMFGAHPSVIARTAVTFVSRAARDGGRLDGLRLLRALESVRGCRSLGKRDMVRNDALPHIDVDPETYRVFVDGELATVPAAERLPLTQRYFLV